MSHYAEAFSTIPGQCLRFTHSGQGHASHHREPVVQQGRFTDGIGKTWAVESCADHVEDLTIFGELGI